MPNLTKKPPPFMSRAGLNTLAILCGVNKSSGLSYICSSLITYLINVLSGQ